MQKLAIVTGGANGIGEGIVRRLVSDGYSVLISDLDEGRGKALAAELLTPQSRVEFVHCDVGKPEDVVRMTELASRINIPVYAVINNAGIFPRTPFLELSLEEWEKVIKTNLTGPFLVTRSLIPHMLRQGDGVVINIVSGLSFRGDPLGVHYTSSKHGLRGLTKSLALALASHGIRVNAIAPGPTYTNQALQVSSPEKLLDLGRQLPLGRIGEPGDIAGVVSFLLGRDARYLTGQTILVNGGADMP